MERQNQNSFKNIEQNLDEMNIKLK